MAEAAHLVAINRILALNIPDFLLTVGNRMFLHDVLKFTTVRWPTRGDAGPMQLGDLQVLAQSTAQLHDALEVSQGTLAVSELTECRRQ
jgi:hypothetical protein